MQQRQIEFKYSGDYRITHHIGSELIEIEIFEYKENWFGKVSTYWKRIYLGHPYPIEKALAFYKQSRIEEGHKE